jgi:aspartyl-tRNA(Asn)/glutamyl-tRNA(Gln) amidotransferase subunit C
MTTKLDQETVRKIAGLARLELSEQEVIQYQNDLEKILNAFEALSLIQLPSQSAQDARSHLLLEQYKAASEDVSRMQKDEVNNSISTQDFLAGCPDREGVFVRVPAILTPST